MINQNLKIPLHLGLIPDGNRRWAKTQGLSAFEGHRRGLQKFSDFGKWCREAEIKIITAFAFSSENWNRPKSEVKYLMDLFVKYFNQEAESNSEFQKHRLRIRVIGRKDNLPLKLKRAISKIEKSTQNFNEFNLNIALNYGGRWDIMEAAKKVGGSKRINQEEFSKHLSTRDLPDIDLIIRAGGEKRLSNFLLWQSSYAEIFFVDKYWPDFSKKDFNAILEEYKDIQRRFGS